MASTGTRLRRVTQLSMVRTALARILPLRVLTSMSVNGEPVPFSQITEEHQDAMTPEEYTAYYEVLSARS